MNKNYLPTNGTKVQKWYKTIKRTLADRLKLYGKSHFYYPKVSIIPSSKANTKPYLLCINGKLQTAISRGSDMLKKSTEIRHICRYSNKVWEFSYVLNLAASWFNASAKNIERNYLARVHVSYVIFGVHNILSTPYLHCSRVHSVRNK